MKPIVKIAILATSITTLITSCQDEERSNLLAEIDTTITEMKTVDSTLAAMNDFVMVHRDSLEAAAAADPKQKPVIDSVLREDKSDYDELQQLNVNHLKQTQSADSLREQIRNGKIETAEAKTQWEKLKAEHLNAKTYAEKNTLPLILIQLTEKNKTATPDSSSQKGK